MTLGRHSSMHSVSNMPCNASTPITQKGGHFSDFADNDYFWDEFSATKPMSTYLLAFLVSEMATTDVEIVIDGETVEKDWTVAFHHIPGN